MNYYKKNHNQKQRSQIKKKSLEASLENRVGGRKH
jgi:hypothetical protein